MPRTPEQNKNIREKRKKRIIENALKAFAVVGFDELTIDDVTKYAKCSHGLFYHYFESKEKIYEEVLTNCVYPLLDKPLFKEAETKNGLEGLLSLASFYLETSKKQNNETLALIVAEAIPSTKEYIPCKPFHYINIDIYGMFLKLAKEAVENKEVAITDPDELASLVHDMVLGYRISLTYDCPKTSEITVETLRKLLKK